MTTCCGHTAYDLVHIAVYKRTALNVPPKIIIYIQDINVMRWDLKGMRHGEQAALRRCKCVIAVRGETRRYGKACLSFLHQSHANAPLLLPILGGDAPVGGKSPMERLFGSRHGACKNIGRKQRNRQFRSHNSWLGFRFTAVNVWSESWRPRRGYTAG